VSQEDSAAYFTEVNLVYWNECEICNNTLAVYNLKHES